MSKFEQMPVVNLESEFIDSIVRLVGNEPTTEGHLDQQIAIENPDLSREDLLAATGSEDINFICIGIINYGNENISNDYYLNFIEHTDKYILSTAFMLDENKFSCVTEGTSRNRDGEDYIENKLELINELVGDPRTKNKPKQRYIRRANHIITTAPENPKRFKAALRLLEEIIDKDPLVN